MNFISKLSLWSWMRHVLGLDEGVELFGAYETQLDGGFAEADVSVHVPRLIPTRSLLF